MTIDGKNQKQIFSISRHPSLPILVCSDGFLMCILKIPSAFASPLGLIKELVNESVEQMNSISKLFDKHQSFDYLKKQLNCRYADEEIDSRMKKKHLVSIESAMPNWALETRDDSNIFERSSDSGVDSVNEHKHNKMTGLSNSKIADGKIIFSFLPQVLPISNETIESDCLVNRLEVCIEYLISSWCLVVSQSNYDFINISENENVCKTIQQAFINFTALFFNVEIDTLKKCNFFIEQKLDQNNDHSEFEKTKILVKIFFIFIKSLNFSTADSVNLVNISNFVEKFTQSILKLNLLIEIDTDCNLSRTYILSLAYNLLKCSEKILKLIFRVQKTYSNCIKFDAIECKKNVQFGNETKNLNVKITTDSNEPSEKESEATISDIFETDSLEKLNNKKNSLILKKLDCKQNLNQIDLIMDKSWRNLFHHSCKYRKTLQLLGKFRENSLKELDMFIIILEREIQKIACCKDIFIKDSSPLCIQTVNNRKSKLNYDISKADLLYFNFGNLDEAIDLWKIQLNSIFDSCQNDNLTKKKSIVIIHKIFYSCLTNYQISKFLNFLEKLIESEYLKYSKNGQNYYSRFTLFENSFNILSIPKPLQKLPEAIISILKSLARFISLYLINSEELFHLSMINPAPMPSLIQCIENTQNRNLIKNILCKKKFTSSLNLLSNDKLALDYVFTADKVFEILLATELYDEAIYFLNLLNDWKSSFLISSILRESSNYQQIVNNSHLFNTIFSEKQLVLKISSILGFNADDQVSNKFESCLMEKSYQESASLVLKELLNCSVMTKSAILEPILNNLMRNLVICTFQLCSSTIIVPENFYLPAPPIFCTQLNSEDEDAYSDGCALQESKFRNKLCILSKCIILLFKESNLFVPLIKWYLENLALAKSDMTNEYGINNRFYFDISLKNLLSCIRYQKIGYIPDTIFNLFREFVAILFLIDLRDKFSSNIREFLKIMRKNRNDSTAYLDVSKSIIKNGILLLSFRSLMAKEYQRIQDIILSTITKLATNLADMDAIDLDLEYALVKCMQELFIVPSYLNNNSKLKSTSSDTFNIGKRCETIRQEWLEKTHSYSNESFEHKIKVLNNENQLIRNYYGINEEIFQIKYLQNECYLKKSLSGAFSFERSDLLTNFLEFFFKFGFDQSENWEVIINHVNNIPLIPEFSDLLREKEFNPNDIKTYILKTKSKNVSNDNSNFNFTKHRSKFSSNGIKKQISTFLNIDNQRTKRGLFRTYSLRNVDDKKLNQLYKKSVSCNDLKKPIQIKDKTCDQKILQQPLKLLDFGLMYANTCNLAIWLIKWSRKFQKILINNNKILCRFDNNNQFESKTTIKLNSLNANMLVACVYLANNNNLIWSCVNESLVKNSNHKVPVINTLSEFDDDFTQVTHSSVRNGKKINDKSLMKKKFNNDISSESSTLDISSLNDYPIRSQNEYKSNAIQMKNFENKENFLAKQIKQKTSFENSFTKENSSLTNLNELTIAAELSNVHDLTEYYDFENLKKSDTFLEQIKIEKNEPKLISIDQHTNKVNEEKHTKKDKKKKNNYERSSKSPKKSLLRNKNVEKNSAETNNFNYSIAQKQILPNTDTLDVTNSSQVHQVIKNELAKIVQLQHDTVMNFLRNQPNGTSKSNSNNNSRFNMGNNNLENQLMTILKSASLSDPMSDIIIETNIKKVEKNSFQAFPNYKKNMYQENFSNVNDDQTNFEFIKQFDSQQINNGMTKTNKISKFVQIPLLKTREIGKDNKSNAKLPFILNNLNQNFDLDNVRRYQSYTFDYCSKLLTLKDNNIDNRLPSSKLRIEKSENTKTCGKVLDKHLMIFSEDIKQKAQFNLKNFPLLKLNATNHVYSEKIKQENKVQTIEIVDTVQKYDTKSNDLSKQNLKSSDAQVQVQKPIYDGYILAPNCFDNVTESCQIDNFSSAKTHFESTKHLRIKQDTKKDSYTMTESNIQASCQLPPDILFKLKFDSNSNDRQKECFLNNDFINIADLDNKSVEEILDFIKIDQNKRKKNVQNEEKMIDLNTIEKKNLDLLSIKNETSLFKENQTDEEPIKQNQLLDDLDFLTHDKIGHSIDLNQENFLNDDKMNLKLKSINEKINSMNKMADEIKNENKKNVQYIDQFVTDLQDNSCINKKINIDGENTENLAKQNLQLMPENTIEIVWEKEQIEKLDLSDDLSELNDLEKKRLKLILNSIDHSNKPVKPIADKKSVIALSNKVPGKKVGPSIKEKDKKSYENNSFFKKIESDLNEKRESMIESFSHKREQDAKNLLRDLIEDTNLLTKNSSQRLNSARSHQKILLKKQTFGKKEKKNDIEIPSLFFGTNETESVYSTGFKVSNSKVKPSLMSTTIKNLTDKEELENQKTKILLDELEKRAINVTNKTVNKTPIKKNKSFINFVKLQDPKKLRTRPAHQALTYSQRLMMHQKNDIQLFDSKNDINELYKVYGSKRVKGVEKNRVLSSQNIIKTKNNYSNRNRSVKCDYGNKSNLNNKINLMNNVHNVRYSPYNQFIFSKDIEELVHWSIDENLKKIIYDDKSRIKYRSKNANRKNVKKDNDQDTLADLDFEYLNDEYLDELIVEKESYINQVSIDDLLNISLSTESSISFIDWDQIDQICENYQK